MADRRLGSATQAPSPGHPLGTGDLGRNLLSRTLYGSAMSLSLGLLAADGIRLLDPVQYDWRLVVCPCAALALTLLALNFLGDGLRDVFDARGR